MGDCTEYQDCTDGTCTTNPCGLVRFVYDPEGTAFDGVYVTGDFSEFAGIGAGALPLRFEEESGLWTGAFRLDPGVYEYQLIRENEVGPERIADPRARAQAAATTSTLFVDCPSIWAPTLPNGYFFWLDDENDRAGISRIDAGVVVDLLTRFAPVTVDAPTDLAAEVRGENLTLLINGNVQGTVVDARWPHGGVVLRAETSTLYDRMRGCQVR